MSCPYHGLPFSTAVIDGTFYIHLIVSSQKYMYICGKIKIVGRIVYDTIRLFTKKPKSYGAALFYQELPRMALSVYFCP